MKVRVDRIAPEGEGIGKAVGSDKVIFVAHALPGESVEATVVGQKPHYMRARLDAVVENSPARVTPKCPYHFRPGVTEYCGGCDWQHAAYPEQLKLKRDVVLDCLRRIGKLQAPVQETLPSPTPWRYRNKVQVPFQPSSRSARRQERQKVGSRVVSGFYMPGSHRIIEFDDCVVQPELSVAIVKTVRELVAKFGWTAYDEDTGEGWLRHVYLRTNSAGQAMVAFVTRTPAFPKMREMIEEMTKRHPQIASIWQNLQRENTSVILGRDWRKIWGSDRLTEKIGDLTLEFSPGAFVQVNTAAAETLYKTAEALLFDGGFRPKLAIDLYTGIGAIAFWIARRVPRVIGIEESPDAVADAYDNARRLSVQNVRFVQGKVELALRRLRGLDGPRPWAAIVDPPRAGCEPAVLNFLAAQRFERIIYVSCNPATFSRDAKRLTDARYELARIQPIDLFPQTSHVELVAQFNWTERTG